MKRGVKWRGWRRRICSPACEVRNRQISLIPRCWRRNKLCYREASRREAVGISLDCFVASLLATTVKGIVIASPPKAGAAISYPLVGKTKNCLLRLMKSENLLLRNQIQIIGREASYDASLPIFIILQALPTHPQSAAAGSILYLISLIPLRVSIGENEV